jgi:hypothetical protein
MTSRNSPPEQPEFLGLIAYLRNISLAQAIAFHEVNGRDQA